MLSFSPFEKTAKDKIICCCCGGGCPMIETLVGTIKAIYDVRGHRFDYMTGGSAGALISGLNMSWNQDINRLETLIRNTPITDWFTPLPLQIILSGMGLSNHIMNNDKLYDYLVKNISFDSFNTVMASITEMPNGHIGESHLVAGTPSNLVASMSIQHVFKPVKLNHIKNPCGDGGVRNLCPIPSIHDIFDYKHVYIILAPETTPTQKTDWLSNSKLAKVVSLLNGALDREVAQIREFKLDSLDNVTVLQLPKFVDSAGILNWSEKNEQIDAAYQQTVNTLCADQK